jgi:hypothetical protein
VLSQRALLVNTQHCPTGEIHSCLGILEKCQFQVEIVKTFRNPSFHICHTSPYRHSSIPPGHTGHNSVTGDREDLTGRDFTSNMSLCTVALICGEIRVRCPALCMLFTIRVRLPSHNLCSQSLITHS